MTGFDMSSICAQPETATPRTEGSSSSQTKKTSSGAGWRKTCSLSIEDKTLPDRLKAKTAEVTTLSGEVLEAVQAKNIVVLADKATALKLADADREALSKEQDDFAARMKDPEFAQSLFAAVEQGEADIARRKQEIKEDEELIAKAKSTKPFLRQLAFKTGGVEAVKALDAAEAKAAKAEALKAGPLPKEGQSEAPQNPDKKTTAKPRRSKKQAAEATEEVA